MGGIRTTYSMFKTKLKDLENIGARSPSLPSGIQKHVEVEAKPEIHADDQLNLFRHLSGIISHPSMEHHTSFFAFASASRATRPAPNLGIYTRVVGNEEKAKRSYKYSSWLINGCLGIQIVVAAALTAMGAAGARRSAVTVFGAINTVIAGILTFLKGSGLPNRFKYYQTEWKRIREYIEQRERDFSRPDCTLDVYVVIDSIENMYLEVKRNLEASAPDRFAGKQVHLDMSAAQPHIRLPSAVTLPTSETLRNSTFGHTATDLASRVDYRASQAQDAVRDLNAHRTGLFDRFRDSANEIRHLTQTTKDAAKDLHAQQIKTVERASREVEGLGGRIVEAERASVPINLSVSLGDPTP